MWVDRSSVCAALVVIVGLVCLLPCQSSPVRHVRSSRRDETGVGDGKTTATTSTPSKNENSLVPYSASKTWSPAGNGSKHSVIRCGKPGEPTANLTTPPPGYPVPQEYKLSGQKWQKKEITWKISKYTNKISHQVQENSFAAAWQRWQDVMGLRIVKTQGKPDIDIRFVVGDHGDGYIFDGPGNVLGHAFSPGESEISGDVHFDDTEPWGKELTSDQTEDHFLRTVALHEFGHALGLLHSNDPLAVMAATLDHSAQAPELIDDDIAAVQALYGKPPGAVGGNVVSLTNEIDHLKCRFLYTAIFKGPEGDVFGILGSRVFTLNGLNLRYPKPLQSVYPGAPIEVDFGVSLNNGQTTYLFNNDEKRVWRFTGYQLDKGYPKLLDISQIPETPIGVVATNVRGVETIHMYGPKKVWGWKVSWSKQSVWVVRDIEHLSLGPYSLITRWTDNKVYFISPERHIMLTDDFRIAAGFSRKGNKGVPEWLRRYCPNSSHALTPLRTAAATVAFLLVALLHV